MPGSAVPTAAATGMEPLELWHRGQRLSGLCVVLRRTGTRVLLGSAQRWEASAQGQNQPHLMLLVIKDLVIS